MAPVDLRLPSCGDGFVQQGVEFCDDGDNNSNAYQSIVEACNLSVMVGPAIAETDGVIQSEFEMCDEGNQDDDICSSCENYTAYTSIGPTNVSVLYMSNEGRYRCC